MVKTKIDRRRAHVILLLYNEETHTLVVLLIVLTSVGRKRFSHHRGYIIIYVRVFTYNNNNILRSDSRKYRYYTLMGERRRD